MSPFDPVPPDDAPPLLVDGLTVDYGHGPALEDVSTAFTKGRLTAIIGPNGAGKSTLLKSAMGLIRPDAGQVRLFGLPPAAARRRVAYVPQRGEVDWDFPATALDVAVMGLYPAIGWFRPVRARHRQAALACLDRLGIAHLAGRQIGRLSGGQQQRVFLARALAQEAELYLMDEPFAGVDASSEAAIIGLLRALKAEGRTIVCVHHDLGNAGEIFDEIKLVHRRLLAEGPPARVLTQDFLHQAYGPLAATG